MKRHALLLAFALAAPSVQLHAQGGNPPSPRALAQREASRLDGEGQHAEARSIWQRLIDEAPDAAAKAAAQRRMAMSHGFEGHCAVTVRYHQMVIDYWKTREAEEPQNAFYQQGEMANESARGCIDAGDLDTAERMYRLGYELGNKEPEPRTHPRSLWEYRMAHALGRLAARRGNKAEAERQVAEARRILDADSVMAEAQERFYPYLVGYVALYSKWHGTCSCSRSIDGYERRARTSGLRLHGQDGNAHAKPNGAFQFVAGGTSLLQPPTQRSGRHAFEPSEGRLGSG
jgi:hypothetical protein